MFKTLSGDRENREKNPITISITSINIWAKINQCSDNHQESITVEIISLYHILSKILFQVLLYHRYIFLAYLLNTDNLR